MLAHPSRCPGRPVPGRPIPLPWVAGGNRGLVFGPFVLEKDPDLAQRRVRRDLNRVHLLHDGPILKRRVVGGDGVLPRGGERRSSEHSVEWLASSRHIRPQNVAVDVRVIRLRTVQDDEIQSGHQLVYCGRWGWLTT